MKFCSLSSSSSGNCEYVEYNNTKILIDAGKSGKQIEQLLDSIDVDIKDIDAIFLTHEHLDHVKGAGVLSRRHNLKVFTTQKTYQAMLKITKDIKSENLYFFENDRSFTFKDLHIEPIKSFHDCVDGSCYNIIEDKKISIVTDTGIVDQNLLEKMKDSDLYYIEANHDKDMLVNGLYPWATKQRIMSNFGHLSNDNAAEILKKLLNKKNEIVMLAHLSKDNNDPKLAARTIRDSLDENNIREGIDYIMEVSPKDATSKMYEL